LKNGKRAETPPRAPNLSFAGSFPPTPAFPVKVAWGALFNTSKTLLASINWLG